GHYNCTICGSRFAIWGPMRGLIAGFGLGVAVGAGGCYLYLSAVKRQEPQQVARGLAVEHPALKYGVPETDIVRAYEGYVAAYDYRTRNPKWVAEHLTSASWSGEATRERSDFFPDPEVDPRFSAKLADFRGSGYDRGHMAPAANHKASQKAMDETFSLVNISPQAGKGFNRDYWSRFERFVKELTDVARDVYVVTGPLWLPTQQHQPHAAQEGEGPRWTLTHDWLGKPPGLVAVPTHFYKVILADGRNSSGSGNSKGKSSSSSGREALRSGSVAVGAFVLPNQPIDPKVPLSAYVVPLEDLEQVAGTRFFPELLSDAKRRAAADCAAAEWRQAGLAQLKPFERVTMKQALAALPPPDTDAPAPTAKATKAAAAAAAAAASSGVVHICEVNACKLPSADFFLRGAAAAAAGAGEEGQPAAAAAAAAAAPKHR
ncbi:hypothetical protein Agub_g11871, partial [Astrephomene gubernaculifera]